MKSFNDILNESAIDESVKWIDRWKDIIPKGESSAFFAFELLCQKLRLKGFVIKDIKNEKVGDTYGTCSITCTVVDAGFGHEGKKDGGYYYFADRDVAQNFQSDLVELVNKYEAYRIGRLTPVKPSSLNSYQNVKVYGYMLYEIAKNIDMDVEKFLHSIRGGSLGKETGITT